MPDFKNIFKQFKDDLIADTKRTISQEASRVYADAKSALFNKATGGKTSSVYGQAQYNRKASINQFTQPEPNVLHKFATYNTVFTLSALSEEELQNPKTFFESKPHDVIAQSSGIDATKNYRQGPPGQSGRTGIDKRILEDNTNLRNKLYDAQMEFQKNNDIYFRSVEILSVPGYNEKRRLTSATKVDIVMVEPYGLTLLEKIKAAAANNGYLDHLDAAYMLTIEFKGFDENGRSVDVDQATTKRVIPVKLVTMDIDVNNSGTVYNIQAIPYNEFAFTNLYMYPRTSASLVSGTKKLSDIVNELQNVLNEQNKQEQKGSYNQYPDEYQITIDERLNPGKDLDFSLITERSMIKKITAQDTGEDAFVYERIRITPGTSILKTLEELMKGHPDFGEKKWTEWTDAVLSGAGDSFFQYFKIRASIVPTKEFDNIRQTNRKKIQIVVEPYYISAMNIVTAGVHNGNRSKSYVAKKYNYIFTGANVDVLNLDINYKVAYFQSRLKDIEASDSNAGKVGQKQNDEGDPIKPASPVPPTAGDYLNLKNDVGMANSSNAGSTGKSSKGSDQFFDAITNPTADMVILRMEIIGDPAWLGQSQFVPPAPRLTSPGISTDKNRGYFTGGETEAIWNPTLKCYNAEVAEPIVDLQFVVPDDVDDKRGIYDISKSQRAVFSGLYKVYQVRHFMSDGQFRQELTMVRYNNQDRDVTPMKNKSINKSKGVVTSAVYNKAANARKDSINARSKPGVYDTASRSRRAVDITDTEGSF